MRVALNTFLLMILSPIGFALTGYQFEVIVFSHITPAAYLSEKWPLIDTVTLDIDKAVAINPLSPEEFLLNNEQLRLSNDPSYQTLLHLAWFEPLEQLAKPSTVQLYGGRLFNAQGNTLDTVIAESATYSNEQNWEMNGTITVDLGRYFDLNFKLLFAVPYNQVKQLDRGSAVDQRFSYFLLDESRRTKSNELNYIDHPLYGILMRITPQ